MSTCTTKTRVVIIRKSKASQTASDLVPPLASKIAANFVSCACFTTYCADGETSVMPHCGVWPSSPFIVRVWVHTFSRPITIMRLGAKHWHDCRNLFVVKAPSGRNIDLAMAVYADDVMRMFATPQSRLYTLVAHTRGSCNEVSDCLVPYSLKHNRQKRMVVPNVKGSRSKAFLRFLTSSLATKDVVFGSCKRFGSTSHVLR